MGLVQLSHSIFLISFSYISSHLLMYVRHRELESFRNYKGFSIIFSKILDAIQRITKVRNV